MSQPAGLASTPPPLLGERTLMRITISGDDRYEGRATSLAIVDLLRTRGFAGATVLHGIMGFGARGTVHSELNEITSQGLPVVIETVETEARIAEVLPTLDRMIRGGVITLERAAVRLHRASAIREGQGSPEASPGSATAT
ncbi:MAG: hypothetical protein ABS52_05795 [Gemmatimonadetes bacterium SCN 70-22]|nr:MAG: hypothetical protein ABS52_05795 [Gemmatimonadetes bacterium SCN 70-22]